MVEVTISAFIIVTVLDEKYAIGDSVLRNPRDAVLFDIIAGREVGEGGKD